VIDRMNIVGLIGRLACGLILLAIALATFPALAAGHAALRSSAPAKDAVISQAPTTVVLEFSGPVVVGPDGVQVFGPDGDRVETGDASPKKGMTITQSIEDGGDGTYGVAYRVSSEDGHVVAGVVQFKVGHGTSGSDGAAKNAVAAAATDETVEGLFSTARGIEIIALLIATGSGIFACCIAPGWRPRLLMPAMLTVLVAYAAGYVLNCALVSGADAAHIFEASHLRESWSTPYAFSLEIRFVVALVALAPAALLAYGTVRLPAVTRWVLAVVFACTAASLSLTGHAVVTHPTWLRLPADAIHIVAASVWLGGLVQLAFLAPQAATRVTEVMRFSRAALTSVIVIVGTGVISTLVELDLDVHELLDSRYGRLILAKILLVLAAMPLARNNQRTFLPVLTSRPDDAPRMLRQYVLREATLLVAVICFTVWLIATPQP
jgi:copper transport protein